MLTVEGSKSVSPIGEVVALYMSAPGLRVRDGWSRHALPNGAIRVLLSYWKGEEAATAEWTVIVGTREVRYSNLYGKYMSWAPDY